MTEAKSMRHSVPIELDLKSEAKILCEELEIEQVVVNLVANAIDAVKELPEKWVKVTTFEEGPEVVLQIIDSGSGVSSYVEGKLFQPFFTTKIVGKGTGLGLSISKGILDQHKASIAINRQMKNTCFEIRFAAIKEASDAT
jgi:C4-dicarboxylate-specific signal transduction histidine kinase